MQKSESRQRRLTWKKGLVLAAAALILAGAGGLLLGKNSGKTLKIGVFMWQGSSELYQSVDLYARTRAGEFGYEVEFLYCTSVMDYEALIGGFAQEGGCILINVITQDISEISECCEDNQVYLLQMWEVTQDTDVLDRLDRNPYFLGYLISDETRACSSMAQMVQEAGCQQTAILSVASGTPRNNVHHMRGEAFLQEMEPERVAANLEVIYFNDAIRYLADQEPKIDALFSSIYVTDYTLSEIKEIVGNPEMKFCYFDTRDTTREELVSGDLLMVACGQQQVFDLALAYACGFWESGMLQQEQLAVICPYLELTSPEEYDLYQRCCVEQPPYTSEQIRQLIDAIREDPAQGALLLKQYAQSYSIDWLRRQEEAQQENLQEKES